MITAYNKGYFIFENIYDVFMLMHIRPMFRIIINALLLPCFISLTSVTEPVDIICRIMIASMTLGTSSVCKHHAENRIKYHEPIIAHIKRASCEQR